MKNTITLTKCLLFICFATAISLKAQKAGPVFSFKETYNASQNDPAYSALHERFSQFSIFTINTQEIYRHLKTGDGNTSFSINKNGELLTFNISPSDLFSENFVVRVSTDNGFIGYPAPETGACKGYVNNKPENQARLSIREDYFLAVYSISNREFCIQPLSAFTGDSKGEFIFYELKDQINTPEARCEYDLLNKVLLDKPKTAAHGSHSSGNAAWVCSELAYAADYGFFQKAGSVSNTVKRLTDIFNLVQALYDPAEIHHKIVEIVVDSANKQNWTTSKNISHIQPTFTSWGNNGGFKNKFDIAVLYTTVDIYGDDSGSGAGLIGRSTISGACTSSKYNIVEYWSAWANDYNKHRVDMAHEMGHNYGAQHISGCSNCIMSPSLNGAQTQWGSTLNTVKNFVAGRTPSCFDAGQCSSAPLANFTANKTFGCGSLTVQFTDWSSGNPTSWVWDFGDGGTSTLKNPSHTYAAPGNYTVKLTATNSFGNNMATKTNYITVGTGTPAGPMHVGPADKSLDGGMGAYSSNATRGMYFQVTKNVTLKSILVYTGDTAGMRNFVIMDTSLISKGNAAQFYLDTLVNLPAKSATVVNFNFNLSPGYYMLGVAPTVKSANVVQDLYRSTDGITGYPYKSADGSVSIYDNIFTTFNKAEAKTQWYVGYDWVIQGSECIPTGISGIEKQNDELSIYPNPTSGLFTISSRKNEEEKLILEVFNTVGEKIMSSAIVLGMNKNATVDLSREASGLYMVRAVGEGYQISRQIVKQ